LQKRKKVWSNPACSRSGRAWGEGATVWAAVEEEGGDARPGAEGREGEGAEEEGGEGEEEGWWPVVPGMAMVMS
jgi:hypothetical protein